MRTLKGSRKYRKNQSELKNIITEMKIILEGIKSRRGDTEENISDLEDRIMEITQSEHPKGKQSKIMRIV